MKIASTVGRLRGVVTVCFVSCLLSGCDFGPEVSNPKISTEPKKRSPQEDYVGFRREFKTRLLREGPSPQEGEPLTVPDGAKELKYQSGSLSLTAFFAMPEEVTEGEKVPAVVFLHGGYAYGEGDWEMIQPYLKAGYAVMIPVLRGENSQPGNFTFYYDEVNDVLAATDEFARQPSIDSERIFIAGHSAGGTLATLSAMASDRFGALASFSGMMDARREKRAPLLVFDYSSIREIQARSPIHYAGSFQCPARLYYGTDEIFHSSGNSNTAARARKFGLDVKSVRVAGNHFSSVPAAIEKSIQFFRTIQNK